MEAFSSQEVDQMVKKEYEMQLYGFNLESFTAENFIMAKNKIRSAMNQTVQSLVNLKPDMAPEMKDVIFETSKGVANEIAKSCREELEKINSLIVEKLQIPDTALLPDDIFTNHSITAADEKLLEEECEILQKAVRENAIFINALSEEVESYGKLEDCLTKEDTAMELVEQNLYKPLDASPTQKIFKDVHKLTGKDEANPY